MTQFAQNVAPIPWERARTHATPTDNCEWFPLCPRYFYLAREERRRSPLKISGHTSPLNEGVRNWHDGRSLNRFGPPGQWRNCETSRVVAKAACGIATRRCESTAELPREAAEGTRRRITHRPQVPPHLRPTKDVLVSSCGKDSRVYVHSGPRSLLIQIPVWMRDISIFESREMARILHDFCVTSEPIERN